MSRWRQLEEDFIGELLVLEVRRLERLEEVEIEVPWRLGSGPFVGCAEEQISPAGDLVFPPFDLVFPNLVAPNVGWQIGQFQHTGQGVEVVLVELRIGERVGLVLNFGIVVDGLLEVEVVLIVLRVVRDELPAHRLHHFLQARLHGGAQEIAGPLRDRGVQAQPVLKFFGGRADLGPDVIGRQPMNRQAVDDPLGHRLKRLAREGLLNPVLDDLTHIDYFPDFWDRTQHGVAVQILPIRVVADQPGLVRRYIVVEDAFDLGAERFQNFSLLGDRDRFEDLQVSWVDREKPDELFKPFGHAAVKRGEFLKVFPNLGPLLIVLGQQPFGNDVGHVLPDDANLLEAILHPAQAVGDELELRVVEQALLQARNEAEADQLADLADFPQEAQVEDEVVLFAGAEVVEQLVHDQEQPVVGIFLIELLHHAGQVVLVAVHLVVGTGR